MSGFERSYDSSQPQQGMTPMRPMGGALPPMQSAKRELPPLGQLRPPSSALSLAPITNQLQQPMGGGGQFNSNRLEPSYSNNSRSSQSQLPPSPSPQPIYSNSSNPSSQFQSSPSPPSLDHQPSLQPVMLHRPPPLNTQTSELSLNAAIATRPTRLDFDQEAVTRAPPPQYGNQQNDLPRRDMLRPAPQDYIQPQYQTYPNQQQQQQPQQFQQQFQQPAPIQQFQPFQPSQLQPPASYNNDPNYRGQETRIHIESEHDGYAAGGQPRQEDDVNQLNSLNSSGTLQLPPKTPRAPSTPMREQFSPHARKEMQNRAKIVEPQPETRQVGTANPPMADIQELLQPAALQPYLPFFQKLGYTDINVIMEMDEEKTDLMLDEVEAEADQVGIQMKGAHKMNITTRIKQERIKRGASATASARLINSQKAEMTKHLNSVSVQPATSNVIMLDGMKGLLRHWCFCVGLFLLLSIIATVFMILYQKIGRDAISNPTGVNGEAVSSTSNGGWQFIYVISILAFICAGCAMFMAVLSWLRNPETRNCNCGHLLPDCKNCTFKSLCPCFEDGCCPDLSCDCCEGCGCGSCVAEVKLCLHGCLESVKDQCHLPDCPELSCGECGCTSCLQQCSQECGCSDCSCQDCCKDCETPNCDCNCCPDCEGDINSCCSTLYKVCCCQCKIQVA